MVSEVPTVVELAETGMARPVARNMKGEPTHYRLTDEGQRVVYAAMHQTATDYHRRTMRALDPEGITDMDQQREDQIAAAQRLRPELSVLQCQAVHAETSTRCTRVERHEIGPKGTAHDAGVTFETNAALHARLIGGATW